MAISFLLNPFTGNFDMIDQVTLAAVGSSPNANAASITSPAQVLTLQPADATNPGVVTATTQSFGGNKLFLGTVSLSSPTTTSGALNIKSISDTLNEGINIEGSGAGANRLWYLSPQSNGDLFLYNPNQGYTALAIAHNGLMGTGPRAPSYAWQVTNADNNTTVTTPGVAAAMALLNSGTTDGNFSNYTFVNNNTEITSAIAGVCDDHTSSAATGHMGFVVANAGVLSEAFRIAPTGNKSFVTLDMNSTKITSVQDPTSAQDAATKNYVDTVSSALNPLQAAYAGSTTNIVGTYLNGVAGVGATFTVTATGAFALDGTTPPQGSRILLKDQSSTFQNGVYTLTTAGSGGVSPILTRSSDFNSASNMNSGDLIPVINGTVNTTTSWLQTATIVTVGTDAVVFVEWTANPSSYLLKANNLSDVVSTSTAFNNVSPMTTLGDVIYGGASGTGTRLAGNTTTTKKFLIQTGTGSGSAAPGWNTLATSDLNTNTTAATSIGSFGSTPNSGGASITSNALILQPADATNPGSVSTTTQSFAGNKTFTGTVAASNLSGTNTGDVTLAAVGAVPSANGASLSGQILTLQPFDSTHPGVVTASGGGTSNFLRADGTWASASGTTATAVYDATNYGLSASVAANALTVALKQPDGSTNPASGTGAVTISFRSSTVTSGAFNSRTVTGALSVVIPSGTTIGTQSGFASYIYIYAIDNSGTVEMALSLSPIPDWSVVTTTAISGGTSPTTMYSTTARTGVPCRYIGRLLASEATAGTWATTPSELVASTSFPQNTPWQQFTSVITGSVSNPTKGGTTVDLAYFRKVGDTMQINWTYVQTSGGANGSGAYRLGLPVGYVADTTKLNVSGNSNGQVIGTSQNTGVYQGWIYLQDSTHIEMVFIDSIGSPKTWGSGQSGQLGGTNVNHSFSITGIPIVGW